MQRGSRLAWAFRTSRTVLSAGVLRARQTDDEIKLVDCSTECTIAKSDPARQPRFKFWPSRYGIRRFLKPRPGGAKEGPRAGEPGRTIVSQWTRFRANLVQAAQQDATMNRQANMPEALKRFSAAAIRTPVLAAGGLFRRRDFFSRRSFHLGLSALLIGIV